MGRRQAGRDVGSDAKPADADEEPSETAEKPSETARRAVRDDREEPPTKPEEPPTETPCPEPTRLCQPGPTPPESSGGGGGGAIVQLPRFKPPSVPDMQLPGELQPSQPGVPGGPAVLDAGGGAAVAAAPVGPAVPIALPVIVAPPIGLGVGGGGAGSGGASAGAPPAAPRAMPAEPPAGRITPPANVGSNAGVPNSSYRIGYTEYLRTAGLPQVAALAVPGLVGILVLTGAGGLLGYRQAKAGHAVHVSGSARFIR